jgi:hypothetical protein
MNFAGMMFPQQGQQPRQPALNLTPVGFAFGRQGGPSSGFVNVGPGGMQAVPFGQQSNTFYGDTPPEAEGWRAVGMTEVPATDPRFFGPNGDRGVGTRRVMVWRKGEEAAGGGSSGSGGQGQAGGQGAPAGPGLPAPRSLDQSALNAMQAANQQAIDQARATYARQNEDLALTVDQLRNMLIASRNESALAMQQQQAQFAQFMLASSDQTGAARALYEGQLSRQMGGLPTPERSAVSPQFGDARTGGRNAVANTLSNLTILSPGSLGNRQGRGSLVGLQLA